MRARAVLLWGVVGTMPSGQSEEPRIQGLKSPVYTYDRSRDKPGHV